MKDNSTAKDQVSLSVGKGFMEGIFADVNMRLQLFDEHGKQKDERFVHNIVTTGGKTGVADQILAAPTLPKMGWMAIGTGVPSTTLLGAEIARVAFDTKTRVTTVITVVATFGAGVGTGALIEAGTFDVVTANTVNMWMSATFTVINKAVNDSLVITWTLTIA